MAARLRLLDCGVLALHRSKRWPRWRGRNYVDAESSRSCARRSAEIPVRFHRDLAEMVLTVARCLVPQLDCAAPVKQVEKAASALASPRDTPSASPRGSSSQRRWAKSPPRARSPTPAPAPAPATASAHSSIDLRNRFERCGLCERELGRDSNALHVTVKTVNEMRARIGAPPAASREASPNWAYAEQCICVFCAQLLGERFALPPVPTHATLESRPIHVA